MGSIRQFRNITMKLRPYHNPDNVDESKVPQGWRFRYADEIKKEAKGPCRMWHREWGTFSSQANCYGIFRRITYIVPV